MAKRKKKRVKPVRTEAQNLALGVRLLSSALLKLADEQQEPLPEPEPFCLILDDIKQIKLSSFIKCYGGDFTGIVLAGEPNRQQLAEAWDLLKNKYYDVSGNESARIANKRHMHQLGYAMHINRVKLVIDAIRKVMAMDALPADEKHNSLQPLFKELALDGYEFEYSPESLDDDLRLVENELIGIETKREELLKEAEDEAAKNENVHIEINEEYFLEQLAELRKFEGFNTPVTRLADEMTVYDYCISMKRYTEHLNRLKTEAQRNGNR